MKLTKRLLSMLVVLTMVLSMIPAIASAKTVQVTDAFSYEENAAGWVEINDTPEFNDWFRDVAKDSITRAAAKEGKTVTAKLVLKANMTLNVPALVGTPDYPAAHNITLDLNGYSVTAKDDAALRAFLVYGGTLTIINSKDTGGITMKGDALDGGLFRIINGTLNMRNVKVTRTQDTANLKSGGMMYASGGTVCLENCVLDSTGSASVGNGGVVYLADASTLTMVNSQIKGGSAINATQSYDVGGNLYAKGSSVINMYGGAISNGHADYRGGNIYLNGATFNMYGGGIIDGTTLTTGSRGANVHIEVGVFNMYGGEITGGNANNGKSIYLTSGEGNAMHIYNGVLRNDIATGGSGTVGIMTKGSAAAFSVHNATVITPNSKTLAAQFKSDCVNVSAQDANGAFTITPKNVTAGTPVAATCTEAGYTPCTCGICGVTVPSEIVMPAHNVVTVPGYDPTCNASGMTDGKACSVCGADFAGQYGIKKTGNHTNEETYVSPEGFGVGSYVTTCTTCGTVTSTVEDTLKLPETATYVGIADGEASEDILGRGTYIMIYPTGLNLEKANGFVGVKLYADDVLLATTTRPAGKPLTTTFAPINIEITRETKNWDTVKEPGFPNPEIVPNRVEIFYGDMETVRGNFAITFEQPWAEYPSVANGGQHTPAEAVKENEVPGNCTAEGSYESVVYCEICDCQLSRESMTAPAAGHTEETIPGKDATCTETGLTEGKKCTVCGVVTVAQDEIPALGHAWDEGVIDPKPTCNDAGVKTYTCATCGETKTEAVDATGHIEETIPGKDATCTETGLTEGKKCTVCGTVTVAQEEIKATGHTEETIPGKDATCTETGLTEGKKCTVCGTVTVAQDEIPAIGHKYEGVKTEATFEADAFTTYTCSVCGDSYTETHEGTQLRVPTANVGKLEAQTLKAGEYAIYNGSLVESTEDLPLEVVVNFSATEAEAGSMADWLVDFNLTFTGMENGSIVADNCYLAGNYGTFGWIAIPTDGMVLEDGVTYPVVAVAGIHLNYNDIVTSVKNFIAAIHIDQAILDANPNLAVNLELVMTDPEDADNKIQVGQDMIYTAEDLKNEEAPLPEALVTPMDKITLEEDEYRVWNGMVREPGITEDKALVSGEGKLPLEVVVNFQAQDTLEECLAGGYAKWLVDFNITIDGLENGSFVADNCYLAGNYGSYGWIKIPLDGQTIQEGVAYPVAALYDPTLNYKDICKSVKNFTAAIHIDQAILDANPNISVKLQLIMTNPNNADDKQQIGEDLIYRFNQLFNNAVAQNSLTGKLYSTIEAALAEAQKGETVILLADHEEKDILIVSGKTLDLNGHKLTAENVSAPFANANIIDSTDGKGIVMIEKDSIAIMQGNASLPVWVAEGGYRFVNVKLKSQASLTEEGNGYFRFYIAGNDANCALQQAMADGGADNHISVRVTLSWVDQQGKQGSKDYVYSDALLAEYAEDWLGNEFRLTVTGMERVTELTLTAKLVCDTENVAVDMSGNSYTITPAAE